MLEKKVEDFLRRKQFHLQNQGILVGVSGGPDSLALLHFLWSKQEEWNIHVVAAHVDHMFRGLQSQQEALFVKEFCEKRNIPVEINQINIPEYMKETGLSSQAAGRERRYAFFDEILKKYNLSLLALGHHGDDQIETILMRLTRGSAGKARAGIPFSRSFSNGALFRPFLCVNREEIEQYCIRKELDPRRDPSNEKDIYSRNRFRKTVLPFLRKENPQVHEHFQRLSEDLESDEEFLQKLAVENVEKTIKKKTDENIIMDIDGFLQLPIPLQRRGIQLILKYLYKEKPASLSAIHIDQIFSIMKNPHPSGMLDFPNGLRIVRSYDEIQCCFDFQDFDSPFLFEMSAPGEILLPNGDRVKMEFLEKEIEISNKDPFVIHIDEGHLPLKIRTRKNGDRMTIKGMEGTKKIKDIFIDEKIPLYKRDSWPVITNRFEQIIWLPGLKKGNVFLKNQSSQQRIICITYKRNELPGGTAKYEK